MLTVTRISDLRARVRDWRRNGERIALVPTMGNLHCGHLSLVEHARRVADRVVVSIFVNPLQFGAGEDFAAYPRTLAQDSQRLEGAGAELLFAPTEQEMYPLGREAVTQVEVPGLSSQLCGEFRPGHFRGVATVVAKLFNCVQPDVAVFGQKDYQQLLVIRRMVADLDFPVEIVGMPTAREQDGLAMSSRNGYLSAQERQRAGALYRVLREVERGLRGGRSDFHKLERQATEALAEEGFRTDYVSIRRSMDLAVPAPGEQALVILAAARLGSTRLIDNLLIELNTGG